MVGSRVFEVLSRIFTNAKLQDERKGGFWYVAAASRVANGRRNA